VIALELGAGASLLIGWQLPFAAGALALFCVATLSGFTSTWQTGPNEPCSSRTSQLPVR
jgi:uncharacterized membrane protein YphA (DoxX/SURF4 family)